MKRKRGARDPPRPPPAPDAYLDLLPMPDYAALDALIANVGGGSLRGLGRRIVAKTTGAGSSTARADAAPVGDDNPFLHHGSPSPHGRASSIPMPRRSRSPGTPSPPDPTGEAAPLEADAGPPPADRSTWWPLAPAELPPALPFADALDDLVQTQLFRRLPDAGAAEEAEITAHITARVAEVVERALLALAAAQPPGFYQDREAREAVDWTGVVAVASMVAPDAVVSVANARMQTLLRESNPALDHRMATRVARRVPAPQTSKMYATAPRKVMLALANEAKAAGGGSSSRPKQRAKRR